MALKLRKGGVWQTISGLKIFSGGAWRTIVNVKIYRGGAWRDCANFRPALSATASPSSVFADNVNPVVESPPITATPSGGLAPYTYSWAVTGGATATNPTSATTNIIKNISFGSVSGTATCTVTDSLGTVATASATYVLERTN